MHSPPAVRSPSSIDLFAVLVVFVLSLLMVEESAAQNRLPQCPESRKVVWTNCHGTVKYKNGTYTGGWLNDQMHGQGHLRFDTGASYKGQFANHKYNGKGVLIGKSGQAEGSFQDDKLHGFAVVTYKSGELTRYEGEFQSGSRHGKGKALFRNGQTYDGEWKDNLIDGYGVLKGASNDSIFDSYEGTFEKGTFHGHGTLLNKDGTKTVAPFTNGKMNGHGRMIGANGSSYVGEYRNNLHHGFGVFTYADGGKHSGRWIDGKRHGQGTSDYIDGTRYTGQWSNDRREGKGTLLHISSGLRYEGEWSADLPSGKFTIWHPNGIFISATLSGSFEKITGDVGIQFPNGDRFRGIATVGSSVISGALYNQNGVLKSQGNWEKGVFTATSDLVSASASREKLPSATEFQARLLASIIDSQNALLKSASPLEKPSIEATLKIVEGKLEALKKELASTPALNTGYLTSVRPDNANTYITARRASELYPKIPYYIPGTRETGEFWIEPVVSKVGEMTFALKFVDVGSTSVEKVRGQIDMTLSETEEAQKALFKLHDWSKTAREQRIRTNFDKRVTCFPEPECPPDGERVEGKASTEIRFFVFEDGSTGGRIQRNKGRFVEAYSVSIDSALLLQAYLSHVIKEAKLEFQAGTQDRRSLQELFR